MLLIGSWRRTYKVFPLVDKVAVLRMLSHFLRPYCRLPKECGGLNRLGVIGIVILNI
jgi:hypothetical protein